MDFIIKDIKENIAETARKIGYIIIDAKENSEYNLVRKLTGENYPRFHIYVKKLGDNLYFNFSSCDYCGYISFSGPCIYSSSISF